MTTHFDQGQEEAHQAPAQATQSEATASSGQVVVGAAVQPRRQGSGSCLFGVTLREGKPHCPASPGPIYPRPRPYLVMKSVLSPLLEASPSPAERR